MIIIYNEVTLRDMLESDIEDYVRWFTVEREWENWDAPWEKEDSDEEAERISWREYYESVKSLPDNILRRKFEIEYDGKHVGWVSSYYINDGFEWTREQTDRLAVGIDICEPNAWGKGIGTNSLRAFIDYYFENGEDKLYTQTWSGNIRMIRCAQKLGFAECNRNIGSRMVNGEKFDGLTFVIKNK